MRLLNSGITVVGVDSFGALPQELLPFQKAEHFIFIPQDFVSATETLQACVNKMADQPSALLHLAGMAGVDACAANPAQAYGANVHLTWEVARFCAQTRINRCLLASTGYVYGSSKTLELVNETALLKCDSVYTATKIAAEHLLSVQARQHGFHAIIMRFSNVYGEGCSTKTVVGTILDQARRGGSITVKDTSPVRDFVFIDDVAEAIERLLGVPLLGGATAVNISTGIGTAIGELVGTVEELVGQAPSLHRDGPDDFLVLDRTCLLRLTGWFPRTSIDRGLEKILSAKDIS